MIYTVNSDDYRSFPEYIKVMYVELPAPEEAEDYDGPAPQYTVLCPEEKIGDFERLLEDDGLMRELDFWQNE